MSFTLAVSAEMVYLDLPVRERVVRLHERGFAVEIWDWTAKDLPELAGTGARFTSMTGYVEGDLIDPDGADALVRTAELSIEASRTLGSPNLNLHGTGLDGRGLPVKPVEIVTDEMWHAAETTLARWEHWGGTRASSSPREPQHRRRPSRHSVRSCARHVGPGE